ncbi:hypothetical protein SAY87_005575 [Trapa incisa]|uniref:RING-type E3 ubiquitin transferase n=1 Tax=Trapa incisa TaxID=236973 RepID=A0AAN7Q761_9MYRT|nr:hypothetical protein SAY87_005575 [Trapa incisa]
MPHYLPAPDDATSAADHSHHGGGSSAPQPSPPKQSQNVLSLLLKPLIMVFITTLFFLFLGLAALILLHICLVGSLLHRRRATHQHLAPPVSPDSALSPGDLRGLRRFKHPRIGASSSRDQNQICPICLDDFRRDQWCRELPGCGHVFHRSCVDTWLIKVASCPVCRARVRTELNCYGSSADNRGRKLPFWPFSPSNFLDGAFN